MAPIETPSSGWAPAPRFAPFPCALEALPLCCLALEDAVTPAQGEQCHQHG